MLYINNLAALIFSGRFPDSRLRIYWESHGRNLQTTPDRLEPAGHEDSGARRSGDSETVTASSPVVNGGTIRDVVGSVADHTHLGASGGLLAAETETPSSPLANTITPFLARSSFRVTIRRRPAVPVARVLPY